MQLFIIKIVFNITFIEALLISLGIDIALNLGKKLTQKNTIDMKNLILSALMLTGVVTFAQETPKKVAKATKETTTTTTVNPATQTKVTKTTEAKTDANGDKQVETSTTVKAASPATPAQPVAPATKTTTTVTKQ